MRRNVLLGIVSLVLVAAVAAFVYLRYDTPLLFRATAQVVNLKTAAGRPDVPVAEVTTVLLKRDTISETLTVYGTVKPATGKVRTYNVTYGCQVLNIMVQKGQLVKLGDVLLEINASPDELLKLEQVQAEFSAAFTQEKLLKKRFDLKLATRTELLKAQSTLRQVKQRLKNLKARGIGTKKKIYAGSESIVYSIESRIGQLLPAGSALVSLVARDQVKVLFGIEPEDVDLLREGQQVTLKTVHAGVGRKINGRIQTITHQVNPSTRLVTVLASPDVVQGLLLNDFIEVQITTAAHKTFVVPRSAVLPDEQGYVLFTVKNNRAIRHRVAVGLEAPEKIEIIAKDIHEGNRVVIMGNYELADGMQVKERKLK